MLPGHYLVSWYSYARVCLIGTNSENGRLGGLGIRVYLIPQFQKRQVGRSAKPSAPKGRRLGRFERFSISSAEL